MNSLVNFFSSKNNFHLISNPNFDEICQGLVKKWTQARENFSGSPAQYYQELLLLSKQELFKNFPEAENNKISKALLAFLKAAPDSEVAKQKIGAQNYFNFMMSAWRQTWEREQLNLSEAPLNNVKSDEFLDHIKKMASENPKFMSFYLEHGIAFNPEEIDGSILLKHAQTAREKLLGGDKAPTLIGIALLGLVGIATAMRGHNVTLSGNKAETVYGQCPVLSVQATNSTFTQPEDGICLAPNNLTYHNASRTTLIITPEKHQQRFEQPSYPVSSAENFGVSHHFSNNASSVQQHYPIHEEIYRNETISGSQTNCSVVKNDFEVNHGAINSFSKAAKIYWPKIDAHVQVYNAFSVELESQQVDNSTYAFKGDYNASSKVISTNDDSSGASLSVEIPTANEQERVSTGTSIPVERNSSLQTPSHTNHTKEGSKVKLPQVNHKEFYEEKSSNEINAMPMQKGPEPSVGRQAQKANPLPDLPMTPHIEEEEDSRATRKEDFFVDQDMLDSPDIRSIPQIINTLDLHPSRAPRSSTLNVAENIVKNSRPAAHVDISRIYLNSLDFGTSPLRGNNTHTILEQCSTFESSDRWLITDAFETLFPSFYKNLAKAQQKEAGVCDSNPDPSFKEKYCQPTVCHLTGYGKIINDYQQAVIKTPGMSLTPHFLLGLASIVGIAAKGLYAVSKKTRTLRDVRAQVKWETQSLGIDLGMLFLSSCALGLLWGRNGICNKIGDPNAFDLGGHFAYVVPTAAVTLARFYRSENVWVRCLGKVLTVAPAILLVNSLTCGHHTLDETKAGLQFGVPLAFALLYKEKTSEVINEVAKLGRGVAPPVLAGTGGLIVTVREIVKFAVPKFAKGTVGFINLVTHPRDAKKVLKRQLIVCLKSTVEQVPNVVNVIHRYAPSIINPVRKYGTVVVNTIYQHGSTVIRNINDQMIILRDNPRISNPRKYLEQRIKALDPKSAIGSLENQLENQRREIELLKNNERDYIKAVNVYQNELHAADSEIKKREKRLADAKKACPIPAQGDNRMRETKEPREIQAATEQIRETKEQREMRILKSITEHEIQEFRLNKALLTKPDQALAKQCESALKIAEKRVGEIETELRRRTIEMRAMQENPAFKAIDRFFDDLIDFPVLLAGIPRQLWDLSASVFGKPETEGNEAKTPVAESKRG